MTWLAKSCPRCSGSLYRETNSRRANIVCLQFGAVFYPEAPLEDFRIIRLRKKQQFPTGLPRKSTEDH